MTIELSVGGYSNKLEIQGKEVCWLFNCTQNYRYLMKSPKGSKVFVIPLMINKL